MDIFQKHINEIENTLKIPNNQLFLSLKDFQHSAPFLIRIGKNDSTKERKICEFDIILLQYINLYENISKDKNSPKRLFPNENFQEKAFICMLLLFKSCIHDIICLRNLYVKNFETQFNSIFRNFFEKFKVFILCYYDKDFLSEYINNDSHLSDKERYYKFFRPKKIDNRIKQNLEKIKEEIKKTHIITQGQASARDSYKVFNDITNAVYDLDSKFVHYNDGSYILNYFLEQNKYNISLYNGSSNYFIHRVNYAIEAILLYYFDFSSFWFASCENSSQEILSNKILLEYYNYIIKEKYRES